MKVCDVMTREVVSVHAGSALTAAATLPVFGELLVDPIHTVQAIDTPFAILLGGLTFAFGRQTLSGAPASEAWGTPRAVVVVEVS